MPHLGRDHQAIPPLIHVPSNGPEQASSPLLSQTIDTRRSVKLTKAFEIAVDIVNAKTVGEVLDHQQGCLPARISTPAARCSALIFYQVVMAPHWFGETSKSSW